MSSPVEKIKERLNIVDIVSSYIKLDKAGANYKARCPFHGEKTPSFFVSPARQNYHCFGCHKSGDLISFVQEIEGLDFVGAMKNLADKAGIELGEFENKNKQAEDKLYGVLAEATDYFASELSANKKATDYLIGRGLSQQTIKDFRLGFADADWQSLSKHLLGKGFSADDIIKAGLALPSKNQGTMGVPFYDRFRSRIMFPLFDSVGRPVAFSGRLFGVESNEGKYVNSPQTALYDKSKILYGFDRAKVAIRREGFAVLVEGQMDLVLSHQVGVENSVAVSGTALTEYHLNLIQRLTTNIVMAFDRDIAGLSASKRAIDMALSKGFEIKAAVIPTGLDPADLIKDNPESWKQSIASAKNIIDFYLAVLAEMNYDSRALKLAVSNEVLPYVARLSNALDRAHFVAKIANFLSVAENPVWEELAKIKISTGGQPSNTAVEAKTNQRDISKTRQTANRIFGVIFWLSDKESPPLIPGALSTSLKEILEDDYGEWEKTAIADKDRLTLEAEVIYEGSSKLKESIAEALEDLKEEKVKERLTYLWGEIRKAESAGNHELLDRYLKECQTLTKLLNAQ